MQEVFKDIADYKGLYQVSNLGNVKSLKRIKPKLLKQSFNDNGYLTVCLYKKGKQKTHKTHQLVAIVFLNHKTCGMKSVVHHIDNNKLNNNLSNIKVLSARENSYTHYKGTSKYKGVNWCSINKKWRSRIYVNGKSIFLGYFNCEIKASNAYKKELKKLCF